MKSITYWHPSIYSLFIRLSYKGNYRNRYKAIAGLIDSNSSVVDVCCGDCMIYQFLKDKDIEYTGLDFNPSFIKIANRRGIRARLFDIYNDEVPRADYILMQASLYQFVPHHEEILRRLFNAAYRYLIVSEPVKNYATSVSRIASFIARILNNPGDGIKKHRFNSESLKEAFRPFETNIEKEFLISDDIEYVAVIRK